MAVLSVLNLMERVPAKRRTRGPRPRGPKPQVCDLCQMRKVKCDMGQPKCSLCTKLGRTCTYARDGFVIEKRTITKENKFLLWLVQSTMLSKKRTNVLVGAGGDYIYFGPSMATHYLASNCRLFETITRPFVADVVPVEYNRQIPLDITRALVMQLVELYFGYLNNFFPLVDPSSFYSQLNTGKFTLEFQVLFTAVCLTGASYYPHRVFGRLIAVHFAKQLTLLVRKVMFRPSLGAVQACILVAYHIGVCDDLDTVECAWFILGVATSMAKLLGVPNLPPGCSPAERHQRQRIWWLIFLCEATISNCFGRPTWIATPSIPLTSRNASMPTLSFEHTHIFITKEVPQTSPETTASFFRDFCHLHILVVKRIRLKDQHAHLDKKVSASLQSILCESPRPYLSGCQNIEVSLLKWHHDRFQFHLFALPPSQHVHTGVLLTIFYSTLIDLNKPFIDSNSLPHLDPLRCPIPQNTFQSTNSLGKCLIGAFMGAEVFRNGQHRIFDVGVPCVWYAAIQFTFMFLYMTKTLPESHWAFAMCKENLLFFFHHFELNADRWAILRDAYFTLKPLINQL